MLSDERIKELAREYRVALDHELVLMKNVKAFARRVAEESAKLQRARDIQAAMDEGYGHDPSQMLDRIVEAIGGPDADWPNWTCPFCRKPKPTERELKKHLRKHLYRERDAEAIRGA